MCHICNFNGYHLKKELHNDKTCKRGTTEKYAVNMHKNGFWATGGVGVGGLGFNDGKMDKTWGRNRWNDTAFLSRSLLYISGYIGCWLRFLIFQVCFWTYTCSAPRRLACYACGAHWFYAAGTTILGYDMFFSWLAMSSDIQYKSHLTGQHLKRLDCVPI